jgi:regulator of protease activity HflC (stomatin/prohibitin superfamily)
MNKLVTVSLLMQVLSRDSVTVTVDAVVYYMVLNQ